MIARKANGRPSAEAFGTPVVVDAGPSHVADTGNLQLTLIRVQSRAVAARGRNLVRFFSDLTEKPVPAVAQCEKCGRFWNVAIDFSKDEPAVVGLPGNCTCGHQLDTYTMNRDLIATARHYAETAHLVNQFEDGGAA